jgi:amino acid transporter
MGRDKEMPSFLGMLHGKYRVPHAAILVLVGLTTLVGIYCSTAIGSFSAVDTLTQVTFISNIGTFMLYGMTCLITLFAYQRSTPGFNLLLHRVVPIGGVLANVIMLCGVLYLAVIAGGSTTKDVEVALGFVVVWLVAGGVYMTVNSQRQQRAIMHATHPGQLA